MSVFSHGSCRDCQWALVGLKRPPDPTSQQMADNDAFLDFPPRRHRLIDDSRGLAARSLMDKLVTVLDPPVTSQSLTFWDDYGEQISKWLPSKALKLLRDFYPFGPRYV
jgi:hypothetical protein